MRRFVFGLQTAALFLIPTARAQDPAQPPPNMVQSGVLPPEAGIVPQPFTEGPSLTPAAVPGDSRDSVTLRRNLASDLRRARREPTVPVPPVLEIEVLDPNVDPLGNPAVIPQIDSQGLTKIDIPPVVLVHRYYYTGDRSFQGPMLPGGPSIVVLNHPSTGQRTYVELQMLPGAPRVIYTRWSVEYDYGPQSIILKFGHHGKAKVVHSQGLSFADRWRLARENQRQRVDEWAKRAGFTEARDQIHEGAANAVGATADGVRVVGRAVTTPFAQILRSTPLGSVFTSDPARRAEVERAALTREAERNARRFEADIPTVR